MKEKNRQCFFTSDDSRTLEMGVYYKDDAGWEIAGLTDATPKSQGILSEVGTPYEVYYCSRTKEYYLSITNTSGNELEIEDSLQSSFVEVKNCYTAYLGTIPDEYSLTINGKSLSIPGLPQRSFGERFWEFFLKDILSHGTGQNASIGRQELDLLI